MPWFIYTRYGKLQTRLLETDEEGDRVLTLAVEHGIKYAAETSGINPRTIQSWCSRLRIDAHWATNAGPHGANCACRDCLAVRDDLSAEETMSEWLRGTARTGYDATGHSVRHFDDARRGTRRLWR